MEVAEIIKDALKKKKKDYLIPQFEKRIANALNSWWSVSYNWLYKEMLKQIIVLALGVLALSVGEGISTEF